MAEPFVKSDNLNLLFFFLYFITEHIYHYVVLLSIAVDVPGESEKTWAFVGLWRRFESFDHRELNFPKQLTV